jgi:type II secretory pathway pseudopilin PulG
MGTQQLLLIVLGVIIVGIALVVGIGIFGSTSQQANADAVTSDCLRVASAAQAWYRKPKMLGGGGDSFLGLNMQMCGWARDHNENGTYVISSVQQKSAVVTGTGITNCTVAVTFYPDSVADPIITLN